MSSTMNSRIRYVRDRCVNAYWMLRRGKFKLILKSLYVELAHRVEVVRTRLSRPEPAEPKAVLDSEFVDKRKVLPPSYRPTRAQPPLSIPPRADPEVLAGDLKRILCTISIEEGASP